MSSLSTTPTGVFQIVAAGTQVPAAVHVSAISLASQLPVTERALIDVVWTCATASRWQSLEGYNAAFVFETPGVHSITMTMTDLSGAVVLTQSQNVTVQSNTRKQITFTPGGPTTIFDQSNVEIVMPGGTYTINNNYPIRGTNVVIRAETGASVTLIPPSTVKLGTYFPTYGTNVVIQGITFDSLHDWREVSKRDYGVRNAGKHVSILDCTFLKMADGCQVDPGHQCTLVANCKAPQNENGLNGYLTWNQGDFTVIAYNEDQNSTGAHDFRSGGGSGVNVQHNLFWNRDNRTKVGNTNDYANNCITMHLREYVWIAYNECHMDSPTGSWGGNIELGPLGGNDGLTKPTYLTDRLQYFVCKKNVVDKQIQIDHGTQHGRVSENVCDDIPVEAFNTQYQRGVVDILINNNTVRKPVLVPSTAVNVRVVTGPLDDNSSSSSSSESSTPDASSASSASSESSSSDSHVVVPPTSVNRVYVYDTTLHKDLLELKNGAVLDLSKLPAKFTLRASITGTSARFNTDNGKYVQLEQWEPYVAVGDNNPLPLPSGNHTVTVVAYSDHDGKLNPSAPFKADFTVVNSPTPPPPPTPTAMMRGVVSNGFLYPKLASMMKDQRFEFVRKWQQQAWTKTFSSSFFDYLREWKRGGVKTMVVWHNLSMPTADQTKRFFESASAAAHDCLDYWEIINEPNLSKYWTSRDLAGYVKHVLKPAYEVLHPKGLKVVGAALCSMGRGADTTNIKVLLDNGYNEYCDYANFHPYGESANDFVDRTLNAASLFGKKPMMVSEWNIHSGHIDTSKAGWDKTWASQLQDMLNRTRSVTAGYAYFNAVIKPDESSQAAVLKADLTKNEPFYTAIKNLK